MTMAMTMVMTIGDDVKSVWPRRGLGEHIWQRP
jgi:hypothetical protein